MKRRLLIFLLLALLVSAGVTAWHFRARLFHGDSSEVFQHYRNTPGIMADYIKNFHLDDSTAISVTILQATDSAAWGLLLHDFCLERQDNDTTNETAVTRSVFSLFPSGHPGMPPDSNMSSNTLLVCSHTLHEIMLADITSDDLLIPIMKYKFYSNKDKEKNTYFKQ